MIEPADSKSPTVTTTEDGPPSLANGNSGTELPRLSVNDRPKVLPAKALAQIVDELKSSDGVEGFLKKGEDAFLAVLDNFTAQLGTSAIKQARKRHGSAVDKEDVLLADSEIRDNRYAMMQSWLLAAGGFSGGSAISIGGGLLLSPSSVPGRPFWWITVIGFTLTAIVTFIKGYPNRRRRN